MSDCDIARSLRDDPCILEDTRITQGDVGTMKIGEKGQDEKGSCKG